MACSSDLPDLFGQDIKLGQVQTKHHEMSCKVTTRSNELAKDPVEESTQDLIKGLQPCSLEPTQTMDRISEEADHENDIEQDLLNQHLDKNHQRYCYVQHDQVSTCKLH